MLKGFSLVELLVAISIIGVLSAIVLSSTSATRKSARVAQRVSDMKRVQSALDLYYANNRSYPSTGGSAVWRGTCSSYNGGGAYTANNGLVIPGLTPDYLAAIPTDPQSSDPDHCYLYTSNGTDYAFLAHSVIELSNGSSGATYAKYPELMDPSRLTNAWKVSSPGGVDW